MELLLKGLACALAGTVLLRILDRQGSAVALPLAMVVCLLVLSGVIGYLKPVIELMKTLYKTIPMDDQMLSTILKAVGISLICQITSLICTDGGSAALGRTIDMVAAAALLWLSIPMITALLELVQTIMGEL